MYKSIVFKNVTKNTHLCKFLGCSIYDGKKIYLLENFNEYDNLSEYFGKNIDYLIFINLDKKYFAINHKYLLNNKSYKIQSIS